MYSKRRLVLCLSCRQQAGHAVNQGNRTSSPRLAQNGVHLPVFDVKPLLNVLGSKLDGNGVPDRTPAIWPRFPPVGLPLRRPCRTGRCPLASKDNRPDFTAWQIVFTDTSRDSLPLIRSGGQPSSGRVRRRDGSALSSSVKAGRQRLRRRR